LEQLNKFKIRIESSQEKTREIITSLGEEDLREILNYNVVIIKCQKIKIKEI